MLIILHGAAGLWLKRREELGFPLGLPSDLQPPQAAHLHGSLSTGSADVVVEIGCEELPPSDAVSAVAQLRYTPACCRLAQAQVPDA